MLEYIKMIITYEPDDMAQRRRSHEIDCDFAYVRNVAFSRDFRKRGDLLTFYEDVFQKRFSWLIHHASGIKNCIFEKSAFSSCFVKHLPGDSRNTDRAQENHNRLTQMCSQTLFHSLWICFHQLSQCSKHFVKNLFILHNTNKKEWTLNAYYFGFIPRCAFV